MLLEYFANFLSLDLLLSSFRFILVLDTLTRRQTVRHIHTSSCATNSHRRQAKLKPSIVESFVAHSLCTPYTVRNTCICIVLVITFCSKQQERTQTLTHSRADPDRDRDPAHCQVPTGIRLASDAPAKEKTANRPQRRNGEAEEKQKKWKMWRKKEWKILNCPHVYYRVRLTHIICSILIQSISSLCCVSVCTLHTIDQRLTLIRHSSSFQLQSFETHWNAMHDSANLYTAISIIGR